MTGIYDHKPTGDIYKIELDQVGGRIWCNGEELKHVQSLVLRAGASQVPSIELVLSIGGAEVLAEISNVTTLTPLHVVEDTDD